MIQLLKNKLQYVQLNYNEVCKENKDLQEVFNKFLFIFN